MDINRLKKELKNYKLNKNRIKALELKLREIENDYITISSPKLDDNIRSSDISNPTELQAIKIHEKKKRYESIIKKENCRLDLLEVALNSLSSVEKEIIELKHLENQSWWLIGSKISYSERQCRRIEEEALVKMLRVMSD